MLSTRDDDISTSSTVKGQVWAESPDEETKQCLQSLRSKVQSMDLTPKELEWCDDACLLRYLRARNNHVDKALELIRRTLQWRKEFGVEEMMNNVPAPVKEEGASQKLYVGGKDKYGRPIIYMKPKYQNTKESIHQLEHLVNIQPLPFLDKVSNVHKNHAPL